MLDTTTEATSIQIAAFRRLSPEARVALALEASDWIMRVAAARLLAAPGSAEGTDCAPVGPTATSHGARTTP